MGSRFEELLSTVTSQIAGVQRFLEDLLRRTEAQAREISSLRERIAGLERDMQWNGEERRKVDQRLGTGDHTFKKLQEDVFLMQEREKSRIKEHEGMRKTLDSHGRQLASRRMARLLWSTVLPALITVLSAIAMKKLGVSP